MDNLETLNWFHKNIDLMLIGAGAMVLWLLRILGGRVIAQYITREQLFEILRKHSENVKGERLEEMKAFEDRLVLRVEEAIRNDLP